MKHPLKTILSADQLQARICELGRAISRDLEGREIIAVGILGGSFVFMADLIRQIKVPLRCDFIKIASYDAHGNSAPPKLKLDLNLSIENREVLLIEDILDQGHTLRFLLSHLWAKKPKHIHLCCLLDKGLGPALSGEVHYLGFKVPKVFLVGYGLDLDGRYRELPYVAQIEEETMRAEKEGSSI